MQYGDINISNDFLVTYLGVHPIDHNDKKPFSSTTEIVSQQDATLLHLRAKVIQF